LSSWANKRNQKGTQGDAYVPFFIRRVRIEKKEKSKSIIFKADIEFPPAP